MWTQAQFGLSNFYLLDPHCAWIEGQFNASSEHTPRVLLPWAQDIVAPLSDLVLMIYDVKEEEFGHVVFLWAILGILTPASVQ